MQIDEISKDFFAYESYVAMYNEYNAGGEDFDEQLEELESRLVENEGINRSEMDKNQKQLQRIQDDIQALR